jgi:O-acetyl-ADP-ribose deacetylase (regulator of RNase III)
MHQITINKAIIDLFIGDLTKTEYDSLVIPTNSRLLPSGDVRCNVLRKAGSTVQVECNKIISEMANISIGHAVITSGGDLDTKFIIHARPGHDQKKLMLAVWNSMKLADENGLTSILFPPISKDVLGFTTQLSAKVMIPTIKKFLTEKNKHLQKVSICLETLPDYKDFENMLSDGL